MYTKLLKYDWLRKLNDIVRVLNTYKTPPAQPSMIPHLDAIYKLHEIPTIKEV